MLSRLDEVDKARIVGKAMALYIDEEFDYEIFKEICYAIDRSYYSDLVILCRNNVDSKLLQKGHEAESSRLVGTGLINSGANVCFDGASLTQAGKHLCKVLDSIEL